MNCERTARPLRAVRHGRGRRAGAQRDPRAPEPRLRGLYAGNETRAGSSPRSWAARRRPRPFAETAPPHPRLASGVEQRRFGWAPFLGRATALSLFAAFYFGGARARVRQRRLARLREQMRRQTIELTRLNEAFAILTGADTTVSYLRRRPTEAARARSTSVRRRASC